jgi:hypothetical protein
LVLPNVALPLSLLVRRWTFTRLAGATDQGWRSGAACRNNRRLNGLDTALSVTLAIEWLQTRAYRVQRYGIGA